MPTNEKRPLQRPTGDMPDEIRAVFKKCEQKQRAVCRASIDKVRELSIQELSFARSQFPRRPEGRVSSEDALSWSGHLYQTLVKLLKAAPNDHTVWYWLAQWLKSEGIREPDRFLPKDVYGKLTKNARQRLAGFSGDYYNSYLVRIWLPYTEPLLRKAKWLRQRKPPCDVQQALQDLGYSPEALNVLERRTPSRNWRSAVEFTCAWVAQKGGSADAETLRNAYSRVFGKRFLRQTKCSFCNQPAENTFWVSGNAVRHCKAHGADQLPTSEAEALPDRVGARWWRQNLDILRTMASSLKP